MQRLPEHCANELLAALIAQGRLATVGDLDRFGWAASRVAVSSAPTTGQQLLPVDVAFVTALAGWHHLARLQLQCCNRLRGRGALATLAHGPVASSLRTLPLQDCTSLQNDALQAIACMQGLQDLDLSGCTGLIIAPPSQASPGFP